MNVTCASIKNGLGLPIPTELGPVRTISSRRYVITGGSLVGDGVGEGEKVDVGVSVGISVVEVGVAEVSGVELLVGVGVSVGRSGVEDGVVVLVGVSVGVAVGLIPLVEIETLSKQRPAKKISFNPSVRYRTVSRLTSLSKGRADPITVPFTVT